ncbi:hypothetical protein CVS40_6163, partial [Lucilia cuprina]
IAFSSETRVKVSSRVKFLHKSSNDGVRNKLFILNKTM